MKDWPTSSLARMYISTWTWRSPCAIAASHAGQFSAQSRRMRTELPATSGASAAREKLRWTRSSTASRAAARSWSVVFGASCMPPSMSRGSVPKAPGRMSRMKLIECVPNFSEGRDRAVLDAISDAVRSVDGVKLLDVDPGHATHRTVFTFVGEPEAVGEAAFRAVRVASERIDMTRHRGEHPRIGAADVVPFVPLAGAT